MILDFLNSNSTKYQIENNVKYKIWSNHFFPADNLIREVQMNGLVFLDSYVGYLM